MFEGYTSPLDERYGMAVSPAPTPDAQRPMPMQFIYFTKHWPGYSVDQLLALARRLGADGLDLAVRKGHAVNPGNAASALPEAVRRAREAGLSVPLVTLETALNDPGHPDAGAVFAACGAAGVPFIKLGYFGWRAGDDFWAKVDGARQKLEGFSRLAERHGVTACYHTHSGGYLGSNASGLMLLIRGFDPRFVGAYLDRGHMAANGEVWPMGLAMAGEHLKVVGGKTIGWYREPSGGGAKWKMRFVPFREGVADWPAAFKALLDRGFDGPVTLHGEYDFEMTPEQHVALLADDFHLAREALKAAETQRSR